LKEKAKKIEFEEVIDSRKGMNLKFLRQGREKYLKVERGETCQ